MLQATGESKGGSDVLGKVMCNDESSCKIPGRLKLLWENYEEDITVSQSWK